MGCPRSPVGDVSSSGSTSDKPMQEIDPASGNSDVELIDFSWKIYEARLPEGSELKNGSDCGLAQ